jgi:RNA polymerase sigma-70 factor (ECF subfamily)
MADRKPLDNDGFGEAFTLYFKELMHFVNGYVRDRDAARDIVHDAFLSLWNNRERLDAATPLRAYLITLARNNAFNYLKHLRVLDARREEVGALWADAGEEMARHEQRLARLDEKLRELPAKQREIIVKCFLEGMTYKQVADELSITVNTVKTHLTRGLNFLRDELQEDPILLLFSAREKK